MTEEISYQVGEEQLWTGPVSVIAKTEAEEKQLMQSAAACFQKMMESHIQMLPITEIRVNYTANRWWGKCCYSPGSTCKILISHRLLRETANIRALEQTLLHEMCHATQYGHGHTGDWKRFAERLNRRYGYDIRRTSNPNEYGVSYEDAPYLITCEECGKVFPRWRQSKITMHPERYRCSCNGHLQVIANKKIISA